MASNVATEKRRLTAIYDRLIELYAAQDSTAADLGNAGKGLLAEINKLLLEASTIRRWHG